MGLPTRPDISRKARKWFSDHSINIMNQSPDLNPIENILADVKKSLSEAKPTNNEQLWKVIKESWEKIPKEECEDLVKSMPNRCAAIIANKGHSTKY